MMTTVVVVNYLPFVFSDMNGIFFVLILAQFKII